MRGHRAARFLFAVLLLSPACALGGSPDDEVVSTMRNVNAVAEAHGFRINPAYDAAGEEGPSDLAPLQAFEIFRADGRPLTLGRLYTSCSCIQLEAPKRNYAEGERAVLQLRNIAPTPLNGQVYAIYVQITSPIRATLRYDTFVQSKGFALTNPPAPGESADSAGDADSAFEAPETIAVAEPPVGLVVPAPEVAAPVAIAEAAAGTLVEQAGDAAAEPRSAVDAAREEMDAYFAVQAAQAAETAPEPVAEEIPAPLPPPEEVVEAPAARAVIDEPVRVPAAETPFAAVVPLEPAVAAPPPSAAFSPAPARKPLETISLITIGVRDMARSARFYEELGWRRASRNKYDQTAFFQLNGQVLALYPLTELLKEQNMDDASPAPGGITLALHVAGKADVRRIYDSFIAAGGVSLKAPTEMPSGAVTGYVADPDGNPWEISWVPQFRMDAEGGLWLP